MSSEQIIKKLQRVRRPNYQMLMAKLQSRLGAGTQLALAEVLNVTPTTINKLANGKGTPSGWVSHGIIQVAIQVFGYEEAREIWESER